MNSLPLISHRMFVAAVSEPGQSARDRSRGSRDSAAGEPRLITLEPMPCDAPLPPAALPSAIEPRAAASTQY